MYPGVFFDACASRSTSTRVARNKAIYLALGVPQTAGATFLKIKGPEGAKF